MLRQLLKAARLWYRFREDYRALPNTKPPSGRALTEEEQQDLFSAGAANPRWQYAQVAATLAFYCGMRACEIKGLQWKDVDLTNAVLAIRRSKTPAGWRNPTLNQRCVAVLAGLGVNAEALGYADPDHYVFPWHGRDHRIDPTRPMTSWRTAWRAMLKAAGLTGVRFHHGRHTAITTLQEKGLPDWVIQAQVGHVSPAMLKTYSHVRRQALNQAAAALEPSPPPTASSQAADERNGSTEAVTSQSMSQMTDAASGKADYVNEVGSSGWTRTSNPPVNSRMLCH